jgi:hypothetical protein
MTRVSNTRRPLTRGAPDLKSRSCRSTIEKQPERSETPQGIHRPPPESTSGNGAVQCVHRAGAEQHNALQCRPRPPVKVYPGPRPMAIGAVLGAAAEKRREVPPGALRLFFSYIFIRGTVPRRIDHHCSLSALQYSDSLLFLFAFRTFLPVHYLGRFCLISYQRLQGLANRIESSPRRIGSRADGVIAGVVERWGLCCSRSISR